MAILNIQTINFSKHLLPVTFAMVYIACAIAALSDYIVVQYLNIGIAIIGIASATVKVPGNQKSNRYCYWAIMFAVLYLLLQLKTFLFFCIVCALFSVVESWYGKLSYLPVSIVLLLSPVTQHFANVFSFPIRLQLTSWAGKLLSFFTLQPPVVHGNIILHNGDEFSVDPECMGLNMLVTSLVCSLVLIAVYQKKYQKQLAPAYGFCLLAVIVAFNIISNLIRIVCLVQFSLMSVTFMHEAVGILCFVLYVILPASLLVKACIAKFGKEAAFITDKKRTPRFIILSQIMLILICCTAATNEFKNKTKQVSLSLPATTINGYQCKAVDKEIFKLDNTSSLVYIKRITAFYRADHQPMVCWRGSGYSFKNIQEEVVDNHTIYTSILQKDKDILYTAWWYDNGTETTISQFNWRWQMLKGKPSYAIINISAATKDSLSKEVKKVLHDNTFCRLVN